MRARRYVVVESGRSGGIARPAGRGPAALLGAIPVAYRASRIRAPENRRRGARKSAWRAPSALARTGNAVVPDEPAWALGERRLDGQNEALRSPARVRLAGFRECAGDITIGAVAK